MEEARNTHELLRLTIQNDTLHELLDVQEQVTIKQSGMLEEKVRELRTTVEQLNREISERRKAEEAIRAMNEQLEKVNDALKHSSAQLVQAAKMTALGELTAGVAHELNQPLNVTKIIAQGILRDIQKGRFSEEDAKKDLPEILNQVNRMAEIITHMRLFARQGDGIEKELRDISTVVSDALKFIAQQCRDHSIEVTQTFGLELPLVMADQVWIEQVVLNLLNNARYAVENSKKQERKVEVKTYGGGEGREVVIEVIDNGMGISDDVKPKLFQPFFTTKDPGKGVGLGLSVCYQIIQEHEGRIEFDSHLGEGTTFRVILPAVSAGEIVAP